MSLTWLDKFNTDWGFPIQKPLSGSRANNVLHKIVFSVPIMPLVFGRIRHGDYFPTVWKESSTGVKARVILASSIVGLPVILLIDVVSTITLQPVGMCLRC